MFGIWDFENNDWFREPLCNGKAILAFETGKTAKDRAAQNWGYDTYAEAESDGWCMVRWFQDGPPPEDLRKELHDKLNAKEK